MDNYVVLSKCDEYDVDVIEQMLRTHMDRLDIYDRLDGIKTVAIKVNLVSAMKPDTAGTTHPAVVEALCRILIEKGCEVVIGDSPGGPFTGAYLKGIYHVCGMDGVALRTGAKLNDDFSQKDVFFENGKIARNITVTSWLLNADAIINCCKLKTHGMMAMSASVKNMFGCIPGTMKPEYHFRFPKQSDFTNMLIDLQEYWKPKMLMHVVDGILGMEGNGPTAGTPRHIGALMSSTDPYAVDLIGGRIIGLECEDVYTMSLARERGLCVDGADKVKLTRTDGNGNECETSDVDKLLSDIKISDYELMDNAADLQFGGNSLSAKIRGRLIQTFMASRPEPVASECIGCRKCEQICPAGAITMVDNVPHIDRRKCIKCFCCQEFCPKGAMKVRRTAVAKLLSH